MFLLLLLNLAFVAVFVGVWAITVRTLYKRLNDPYAPLPQQHHRISEPDAQRTAEPARESVLVP